MAEILAKEVIEIFLACSFVLFFFFSLFFSRPETGCFDCVEHLKRLFEPEAEN